MPLSSGTRLGPYEILSPIGAGGMGEVYRARHVTLQREAAIKVLPRELSTDPERLRRFVREARAASALNHPGIVTIYDIGEDQGTSYIAMELVEGVTLRHRMRDGPLDLKETLRLVTAIAEPLARAHEAGIVHRDLKPENVMVTPEGQVKILDFGVAKHTPADVDTLDELPTLSHLTNKGVLLGTVPYMSPEQASGHPVNYLSDQFSFGVMLYEMLCGQRPFQGSSAAKVISGILRDDPPPPGSLRITLPRELEAILQRCLEKDPRNRYASTREMTEALRSCEQKVVGGGNVLPLGRRTVAGVLAVLVLAGSASIWYWLRDDAVRWVERGTLTEITRLTESGELYEAWRLTRGVLDKVPEDRELRKMIDRITIPISIVTEPDDAEVQVRKYASPDAPWVYLGQTPLEGVRLPYALTHWKISKEGFETFEGAPFGVRPFTAFARGITLIPEGAAPDGMVRVPGGPYVRAGFPPVELADYWLDRYEVTNREFKRFVDAGGYDNPEYWTQPFVDEGRELTREKALSRLVDRTGRPGPAGWEFGAYAEGEGDLPAGGVSWYEAAAYCEFVGKRLPTLFHWSAATVQDQLSDIVGVSNFGRDGPAPVGSHLGLGDFGTYDMAGNVKEWCWNEAAGGRHILGGAWGEPTYMFRVDADVRPPLARDPSHGFRCARFDEPSDETLLGILTPTYHEIETEPVPDAVFAAFRSMYSYDRRPLDAVVESVDESSPHWRKETVSFAAAYGGERVIAHIFLPRDVAPPYQPVIWFPGNDVFFLRAGESLASSYLFDFIPRSGRVLVYPVYKGTYERSVPFSFAPNEWRDMIVLWSKDIGRTVDYLEERSDIDEERLAYYGFSSGAGYGPIFTAVDDRFKANILLAGGLFAALPPEADLVNFAPRSEVPTLMINGEDDFLLPFETSQKPLFDLLGAPEGDKRHARLEGGHLPPDRLALIDEVVSWLDHHLGPAIPTRTTSTDDS